MPLSITHRFVSSKSDSSDATLIQPSSWNDEHVIGGVGGDAFSEDFDFSVQTPTAALTGGVGASVTLTPVPRGINGSDSGHYLRINSGGGSSENILITGGTAVGGTATGTIQFTPVNNHAANSYNIGSANSGIAEAQQYLLDTSNGGTVRIGPGVHDIRASIKYQPNMSFVGSGKATTLRVLDDAVVVFDGNVPVKSSTEYNLISDNVLFADFVIDAIEVTGINNVSGIRGIVGTTSTEVWGYFRIKIENVDFNNAYHSIQFHRSRDVEIVGCALWYNSTISFTDSTLANSVIYNNADIIIDRLSYVWHPMDANSVQATMVAPVINLLNTETVKIVNSFFSMRGSTTNTGLGYAISLLAGEDLIIHNCTFLNVYTGIYLGGFTVGGISYWAGFVTITDCSIDQIWGPAIVLAPGASAAVAHQVGHIQVMGNQLTDMYPTQAPANFLFVGQYSKQIVISDNIFRNIYGSIAQNGLIIQADVTELTFGENIWDNETADVAGSIGIAINAGALKIYGLERNLFNAAVFGTTVLDGVMPVASATALPVPVGRKTVTVSGVTTITSMTYGGQVGDILTLLFTGALQVTKGNNIKINANFTSSGTATGSLTLCWDGTNMIELSRSAN